MGVHRNTHGLQERGQCPAGEGSSLWQLGLLWAPQMLTQPFTRARPVGVPDGRGDRSQLELQPRQGGPGLGGESESRPRVNSHRTSNNCQEETRTSKKVLGQDPPRTRKQNCLQGPCYRMAEKTSTGCTKATEAGRVHLGRGPTARAAAGSSFCRH